MDEIIYKHLLQLSISFSLGNARIFDLLSDGRAKLSWDFSGGNCNMTLEAGDKKESVSESMAIDEPLSPEKRKIICAARAFRHAAGNICGYFPEWGVIDGVKPVRLYLNLIESGLDGEKILRDNYLVSEKKAELVRSIGDFEHEIASKLPRNSYNLYISIPFCPSRCKYCSFISADAGMRGLLPEYLEALHEEIARTAEIMKDCVLHTVYIGGGTPTVLNAVQLERLLLRINECFDVKGKEFTLEAGRPDTVTAEKLDIAYRCGVNRVSINTQTTNNDVLKSIGRHHTAEEYFSAFEIARHSGIPIINTDLIAGFDNDTFEKSLSDVIALSPENLTVHTLCVKNSAGMRDEGFVRHESGVPELLEYTLCACHNNQYFPYYLYKQKNAVSGLENVGYSKKGCECVYNICMMSELNSTVALGAGASTKMVRAGRINDRTESFFDCKYPKEYIENGEKTLKKYKFLKDWIRHN